jgi:hypothetical protein
MTPALSAVRERIDSESHSSGVAHPFSGRLPTIHPSRRARPGCLRATRTITHESRVTFKAGTLPASGVNFFRSL